ncbi:predicted protein [Plenodomus lingam JN3]|uniref:Uncharacterized protein n=1 Tax=Leptosphaeria maculans (strain JN3 / isolate v23.1.3 / race Av1-4-5-6-7-8) TaxID=985895 RepID=E5A5U5_LEPMJ|nr:predicted protein [Plenodomus lingam JN3]CBX98990.1 predicted protein [Plenodomus lingam JN3]
MQIHTAGTYMLREWTCGSEALVQKQFGSAACPTGKCSTTSAHITSHPTYYIHLPIDGTTALDSRSFLHRKHALARGSRLSYGIFRVSMVHSGIGLLPTNMNMLLHPAGDAEAVRCHSNSMLVIEMVANNRDPSHNKLCRTYRKHRVNLIPCIPKSGLSP